MVEKKEVEKDPCSPNQLLSEAILDISSFKKEQQTDFLLRIGKRMSLAPELEVACLRITPPINEEAFDHLQDVLGLQVNKMPPVDDSEQLIYLQQKASDCEK